MKVPVDPAVAKRNAQRVDFTLGAIALLIVALAIFQFFLRYAYVHTVGNKVVRIDRVSGQSCVLPCNAGDNGGYGPYYAAYVPPPTPRPDKVCHTSHVVRVAGQLTPPVVRTPTPYSQGGFRFAHRRRHRHVGMLSNAVELSDGHIYVFSPDAYQNDVASWATGQELQVCATWSKLERRPFFSIGTAEEGDPATLAL